MKSLSKVIYVFLVCIGVANITQTRNIFRQQESWIPAITTCWDHCPKKRYTLRAPNLEKYPLFEVFDKTSSDQHILPNNPIAYRYKPNTTIDGKTLSNQIEVLLKEIKQKKKVYTHFSILRKRDFNRHKMCGLLIVKFKDYPFVLKLFLETPQSFTNPHCKGFVPMCFFYLSPAGVNRHLTGFTRLKNLDVIHKKISSDPEWTSQITTPRKWFWLPKKSSWMRITGEHFR